MIRKLGEGERLAAGGMSLAEVARALEISEQTHSRWRNQYGGMKADDAKGRRRLKGRERAAQAAGCRSHPG